MDIAALATMSSQMNISTQADILVLKKAMDTTTEQSNGLLQLMNTASPAVSPPNLGNNIDISV
ncbi:YjfB family protein [Sporomusa acidovorans]|uniref:Motility protein n=1 Tax=Sporomusa acidovorans (strain ATCC 49682 / DSM 3132 / Mol) TaxID=1123286 RepID=A0ABZ3JAI6_SPOA4|nr:YjfB family protein [Sporomusa acidovorans]OZC21817.1 hypothetical protein SPACI_18920 [Sporomusa acidovorans DSM 3132]SDD55997.1 Putative motility protein [Sporomusa acidovorans]